MDRLVIVATLSALHALALAIGLGAVFARGKRLRDLRRAPENAVALKRLFQADGVWGTAALLWIATGFGRVFGGLEKSSDFFLRNGFFWVKLGLFGFVLVLEILPMITFIRWRLARSRGIASVAGANFATLIALNDAETAIVVVIPFVAALMARGVWLF